LKYIILAAGKGIESFQEGESLPKCLLPIKENKNIIDNILNISDELNIKDVNIIGGYKILEIMKQYPQIKYFYNEMWENTNNLYSLSKILDYTNEDILISYSDILYTKNKIESVIKSRDKINIVYDSYWKKRYEGSIEDDDQIEKIYKIDKSYQFSKDKKDKKIMGEFTGLFYIPKFKLDNLKILVQKLLKENKKYSILDFLDNYIEKTNNNDIKFIDIKGNWAELDSIQDVEHFNFGTKAETLKTLKERVTLSKVLSQYSFTVQDYKNNSNKVLQEIQKFFNNKLLVVRSSAINEDTHNSSMAGNYESILKVKKNDLIILKNAVEIVIQSYTKNNQEQDERNQILVQPYLEDVTMSGVLFSKNLQTNSPYYTINYDESDDTESVTSGNGKDLNTFICYRNAKTKVQNSKLHTLINSVKEIENVTKYDAIDVEFAFAKEELFILQVRPIAAKKNSMKVLESDIKKELQNLKEFVTKLNDNSVNLLGEKIAYGVMPDWNPAEIIGINPKKLAFDLYKYIITDSIWAKSRKDLGYKDVKNANGLVSFAGKPYVDIKMSFNTFIPNEINDKLASKLVDFFILKLQKNPSQHDKVEFNIVLTAFDFLFDEKMKELQENDFSDVEIKEIYRTYKKLTENIINGTVVSIEDELNNSDILNKRREEILNSNISISAKIYNLLEDCKTYGTLSFAKLARCGFIGSIFLKSLLEKKAISSREYDNFVKSIHTVAKTFIDDLELLQSNKISKEEFIKTYGHLRPGTYDITSHSYKDNFENYIKINNGKDIKEKKKYIFNKASENLKNAIETEIKLYDLDFNSDKLLEFITKATEARELSKFEFTKNLNAILELIALFGQENSISKDDSAFMNLNDILSFSNESSKSNIRNKFEDSINENKTRHLISNAIHLPELIFNINDTEMFFYSQLKPNFVTHHNITGEIRKLENDTNKNIDNKIVIIENADPGFDWIFSHKIKGLVTKYGGAASHMAIRCAEFDIPAAIGCGDKIYVEVTKSNSIILDCANQIIKGLK
jgi:glutamine kinase